MTESPSRSFRERLEEVVAEQRAKGLWHEPPPLRDGEVRAALGIRNHEGNVRIDVADGYFIELSPELTHQFGMMLVSHAFNMRKP